jgi:hypothetical protein
MGRIPSNTAAGDFNGDGRTDSAAIFVNDATQTYAAVARIDTPQLRNRPILLRSAPLVDGYVNWSLDLAPPQRYDTYCGRTDQCGPGEPAFINLRYDGLFLSQLGSASALVYWDPQRQRFSEVFLTD